MNTYFVKEYWTVNFTYTSLSNVINVRKYLRYLDLLNCDS